MINGKIFGDDKVVGMLLNVPERVQSALRTTIGRNALFLQRKVVTEKLSGQVLKVRTGNLRRSIDSTIIEDGGNVVGVVSTNVKYGRIHEYGFSGTTGVKADLRQRKKAWRGQLKNPAFAFVSPVRGDSILPARSFLRSALAEVKPKFIADVEETVRKALDEG